MPLTLDPATDTFPGNNEANKMLTRSYREGYLVPAKV